MFIKKKRERTAGMEIRLWRTEKGQSLREVSDKVGISENYLSEIERGKKQPNDEIIRNIAKYFNVDEKFLFDKFERIPLVVQEELHGSDTLSRTLYDISTDTDLTEEEKEDLYKAIQNIYKSHRK
jgi:transcriptional regulator with XRE-family HTH domain